MKTKSIPSVSAKINEGRLKLIPIHKHNSIIVSSTLVRRGAYYILN